MGPAQCADFGPFSGHFHRPNRDIFSVHPDQSPRPERARSVSRPRQRLLRGTLARGRSSAPSGGYKVRAPTGSSLERPWGVDSGSRAQCGVSTTTLSGRRVRGGPRARHGDGASLILSLYASSCPSRAISRYRHSAFTSFICRGVLHSASNNAGLATRMHAHRAREVATLRRFRLKRKSRPRGFLGRAGGHGVDHHGGFLALEAVDGADIWSSASGIAVFKAATWAL